MVIPASCSLRSSCTFNMKNLLRSVRLREYSDCQSLDIPIWILTSSSICTREPVSNAESCFVNSTQAEWICFGLRPTCTDGSDGKRIERAYLASNSQL